MKRWNLAAGLGLALAASSCGGGGRYGYARSYVTLGDEAQYAGRATSPVYDEVRRQPHDHTNQLISWFGIVTDVAPGPDGQTRIALDVRAHQERHLCEEPEESSCRVTVSEQPGGPFSALVRLHPEDLAGENRLQAGSLLRVYGELQPGEYDAQGGPVLRVQYYRHWPRGQYVTTALRSSWRR